MVLDEKYAPIRSCKTICNIKIIQSRAKILTIVGKNPYYKEMKIII
jgi:hypothetical protein